MKPPCALYIDFGRRPSVYVGAAWTGGSIWTPSDLSHPTDSRVIYRVMFSHGCNWQDVRGAFRNFMRNMPTTSFRDCMVHPEPENPEDPDCATSNTAVCIGPSYASLKRALDAAYAQSAEGKGRARHGNGLDFDQQPIMRNGRLCGIGGPIQQVLKKSEEAIGMHQRGEDEAAKAELLGAIVYAAAAYLLLDEKAR